MSDSYVIMYDMHHNEDSHTQVAEVCASLEAAQKWLKNEPKGKVWAHCAKIEGKGLAMRLVTNFSETNWSVYYIRRKGLIS